MPKLYHAAFYQFKRISKIIPNIYLERLCEKKFFSKKVYHDSKRDTSCGKQKGDGHIAHSLRSECYANMPVTCIRIISF